MKTVWGDILILVFAHFVVSLTHNKCGEPTKYLDKQLTDRSLGKLVFDDQETVAYKCVTGYSYSGGNRISQCREGQWTTLNMNCERKKCNALGEIENGQYIREGQLFHDKAIAVCNKGYVLKGERVRVCLEYGWNGTDPICEESKIICSAPAVANRWVKPGERTQYTPQDTVTIICSEGFDRIGLSAVTCGPDGQWLNLPECRPKGKCGPAPSYPNMDLRDLSSTLKEYPSGARIRYRCGVGHRRARGSDSIRCQGGQWTKLLLRCELKKCGSAGEISYGRFEYSGVLFGHSAKAICQEGYELIGKQMLTCRDGGWDGRIPVCEPVHCPPPPEVMGAEMSDPIYDYVPFGRVVSYHCRTGALIGAREIYCTQKGTWSAPPPKCKDIACPHPHVPDGTGMRGFRSVYKFGNTVTISCRPGLRLIGESFVTCGPDGKWKPKLPKCVQ